MIAAPCTGPVLAGVLAYVATQRNAVLGFWMLFTYAVGMGLLFFVLGATSLRLPRSGAWMETVKSVLGIALLAAAVALLLPLLPRAGMLPLGPRAVATLAGVLAFAGVLAGALSLFSFHGDGREKAMKLGRLVLLLAGVAAQRFGWLGAPRIDKGFESPGFTTRSWRCSSRARPAGRCSSTWGRSGARPARSWTCTPGRSDGGAGGDGEVRAPQEIDATEQTDEIDRVMQKYDVAGLPTVLMMACKDDRMPECAVPGEGPARVTGFLPPEEMLQRLRRAE